MYKDCVKSRLGWNRFVLRSVTGTARAGGIPFHKNWYTVCFWAANICFIQYLCAASLRGDDSKTMAAHDEGHWAYQEIGSRIGNDNYYSGTESTDKIDQLILSRLKSAGLEMAGEADRITWFRRVSIDLTGLPPGPDELERFENDTSAGSYERAVEILLSSPEYGERWGQHWLDVVRYADTHGFEVNTPRPNAWPYRDEVIRAFNEDRPYDRFIVDQICGDMTGRDSATGFLVTAAALLPGQIGKDAESMRLARQDELTEVVINISEAFLGLSIGCARCHDHKSDPITSRDFYSFQAFFSGLEYGERAIRDRGAREEYEILKKGSSELEMKFARLQAGHPSGIKRAPVNTGLNIDTFKKVSTSGLRFTIHETMADNRREPCIDEFEIYNTDGKNVALGTEGVRVIFSGSKVSPGRHEPAYINDGVFGNSSSWMSDTVGGGWVEFQFERPEEIDRVQWSRDRYGEFADRLPTRYTIEVIGGDGHWLRVSHNGLRDPLGDQIKINMPVNPESFPADLKVRITEDLSNYTLGLAKIREMNGGQRMVFAGRFRQPDRVFHLNRGNPEQPEEELDPNIPVVFGSIDGIDRNSDDRDRRMALARWITDPQNPLTARVMVNRIWQWHFGVGLVDTPNDFGVSGSAPTHPELLDWLAHEFIRSGWSVKHMHRLIVLSATYRQSADGNPSGYEIDADNRLLWHYPSRRMEAEAIRDSILYVNGELNLSRGGPGFNFFTRRGGLNGFPPVEEFSAGGLKRMIYAHKVRMEKDSVFGAFDCPDAGQSLPRRRQSTTPIQALNLLNSRFVIDQSEAFAERVELESGKSDPEEQVRAVWRHAYGRFPDDEEIKHALALINTYGLSSLCRAVYNSSEFLYIP